MFYKLSGPPPKFKSITHSTILVLLALALGIQFSWHRLYFVTTTHLLTIMLCYDYVNTSGNQRRQYLIGNQHTHIMKLKVWRRSQCHFIRQSTLGSCSLQQSHEAQVGSGWTLDYGTCGRTGSDAGGQGRLIGRMVKQMQG